MHDYDDLIELARICIRQAQLADDENVATELGRLAREYQQRAAEISGGGLPDIRET
jgi:hypothetical protein